MTEKRTMPNATATQPTPNDILASDIADALVAANLITDTHKKELLAKLKTGGVTQNDWGDWIGAATAPQIAKKEAKNG